jgi:hypothetical protein
MSASDWPNKEFTALPVREQLGGYAMEPEILIDGPYPILRVSMEMTRLERLATREAIRNRSFRRAVYFWWPWTLVMSITVTALIATNTLT